MTLRDVEHVEHVHYLLSLGRLSDFWKVDHGRSAPHGVMACNATRWEGA